MILTKKLIENYIKNCYLNKNLSKNTLKSYNIDLNQLHMFFQQKNLLEKQNWNDYICTLTQTYKPKTCKRKIASFNAFFTYLMFEEIIEYNPLFKVETRIKDTKTLPKIVSKDNLHLILNAIYINNNENKSCYKNLVYLRNIAIFELFISTGLRISELSNLKTENVNLNEKYIRILGKGSKERILEVGSDSVYMALSNYHKIKKEHEYFFINRDGNQLSDQSVRIIINNIIKECGITTKITPHMFRHTFATMLLEQDVDIRYIQHILGHSSITTTQIYTHIHSNKQKEIMNNKNPRNLLKNY